MKSRTSSKRISCCFSLRVANRHNPIGAIKHYRHKEDTSDGAAIQGCSSPPLIPPASGGEIFYLPAMGGDFPSLGKGGRFSLARQGGDFPSLGKGGDFFRDMLICVPCLRTSSCNAGRKGGMLFVE